MKMEGSNYETTSCNKCLEIIEYSPPCYEHNIKLSFSSLPWFDVRVFYMRVSGIQVNKSTPLFLLLHQIPLNPDTLFEINGVRSSMYTDNESSVLRRDRMDKKSEEVTFVNIDSIRLTGSMKFEVFDDKGQCFLSGVLQMSNEKKWSMSCSQTEMTPNIGFFKGKHNKLGGEIEVYVAGSFSRTPIILTKTLQINCRKKLNNRKYMLDVIPEYETTENQKDISDHGLDLQVAEYRSFKQEQVDDYNRYMYCERRCIDWEEGEVSSLFNAGVRVGVGIGLGICVGVGIGISLLARSYQTTTRNFKTRLI